MATVTLSYNEYNTLPTLGAALTTLESFQKNQDLMLIGDIFFKHAMQKIWGLCLVHRHFDLTSNEAMVEQPVGPDGIIVTKAVDVADVMAPFNGSNYFFNEYNKLQPFEYRYGSNTSLQEAMDSHHFLAFLHDLNQRLTEAGLCQVLGLTPLESITSGVETTDYDNRENIVKPLNGKPLDDNLPVGHEYVPAAWAFNEDGPGVQRGCTSVSFCVSVNPPRAHASFKRHD